MDELLARIAWLYYMDEMSQQEIADRLELPRIKVLRLLKEAKARGLVDVRVNVEQASLFSLEHELAGAMKLDAALVVPSGVDPMRAVGQGIAYRFSQALRKCRTIGMGIGRTLHQFAQMLDRPATIKTREMVSLVGNIRSNMALDPLDIAYTLATKLGVDYFNLWAPAWAATPKEARSIMGNPSIAGILRRAENVDIAFIGVGSMKTSMYQNPDYLDAKIFKDLIAGGFVGEVLGHFFDINGVCRPHPALGCHISVTMPLACPIVAAAAGVVKKNAVIGAWRAGFMNELIVDEDMAVALLKDLRA